MHLLYFGVPLIVAGVILLLATGPFGLIPLVLGIGLFGYRLSDRFRSQHNEPSPGSEDEPGPGIGYANPGQAHMTPDQGFKR